MPHRGWRQAREWPGHVAEIPIFLRCAGKKDTGFCMFIEADPDEFFKTKALISNPGADLVDRRFATSCHQAIWKIRLKRGESPQKDVRKTTSEAGMLLKTKEDKK